jgi:GAF domain-containing protein
VLQVINSSPGDLAPVFDAMLEKATRLCDAAYGQLWTYDAERFHPVTMRGDPAFTKWVLARGPLAPAQRAPHGRIVQGEPFVHIADALKDEAYRSQAFRESCEVSGTRTQLVVPLRKDEVLLGVIHVYRREVRLFTDKQISLLQSFATQAVIAMENARLLTETREALEKQTATAEILRVISRSPTDLQPTFDAIAASAATLCGATGSVFRFDGSLIHFAAHYGWTPEELGAVHDLFPLPPGRGSVTARAILTRAVAHVPDLAVDPELHPSLVQSGFKAGLSVPMLRDGQPIGAITVTRHEAEPFLEAQIELLKTFADQAVIAIENVRLFNELSQRTSDLEESLEYQTATSDVLQVISRSTFDLQPIFDTIVSTAARLCDADDGIITIRESDTYKLVSSFGAIPGFDVVMKGRLLPVNRGSLTGRTALEGEVVHVRDIASDPEYTQTETLTLQKNRTMLGVPLLRDEGVVGTINLGRLKVEPFSERQIQLVRTFADQAVIAIENTRLITETREALEQQTATAEVLQVINSSPASSSPSSRRSWRRRTTSAVSPTAACSFMTGRGFARSRCTACRARSPIACGRVTALVPLIRSGDCSKGNASPIRPILRKSTIRWRAALSNLAALGHCSG